MIVNKTQLSGIIGRSENWLTDMQKQHDFPIHQRGRGRAGQLYDTAKVIEWMEKRQVAAISGNQTLIDLDEGKRRKMAAEAGLAELELLKEQGAVIEIDKVADEIGEQLSNFRAKMLSIPSKVSGQVYTAKDMKEIKGILEDAIYEALNEISGLDTDAANGKSEEGFTDSDGKEAEAATETDGV